MPCDLTTTTVSGRPRCGPSDRPSCGPSVRQRQTTGRARKPAPPDGDDERRTTVFGRPPPTARAAGAPGGGRPVLLVSSFRRTAIPVTFRKPCPRCLSMPCLSMPCDLTATTVSGRPRCGPSDRPSCGPSVRQRQTTGRARKRAPPDGDDERRTTVFGRPPPTARGAGAPSGGMSPRDLGPAHAIDGRLLDATDLRFRDAEHLGDLSL